LALQMGNNRSDPAYPLRVAADNTPRVARSNLASGLTVQHSNAAFIPVASKLSLVRTIGTPPIEPRRRPVRPERLADELTTPRATGITATRVHHADQPDLQRVGPAGDGSLPRSIPTEASMNKLYKRENGSLLYQEAWVDAGQLHHHHGVVGQRGEHTTRPLRLLERQKAAIDAILEPARAQGYAPLPLDEHATLVVEYVIDGFGSGADLDKRHALEEQLNEILGWTGLGHCDGGSIGSGTMEVFCPVVDYDIARDLIVREIAGTEYADYSRIYREED
jgi:hypothetical protein